MVNLKIRSIDFNYDSELAISSATVRFDSNDQNGDVVHLNGSVRVTLDEYNSNATNFEDLAVLVMSKIKNKITD